MMVITAQRRQKQKPLNVATKLGENYTPQLCTSTLLLLLLCFRFTSPVSFDRNKNFLWIKWSAFMVHDLALPSHPFCNALYLYKELHCIPEYNRPFWPQNSIHLQQNVNDVASSISIHKMHVQLIYM